jgi:DNA-binding XRE family transcriptional regulator
MHATRLNAWGTARPNQSHDDLPITTSGDCIMLEASVAACTAYVPKNIHSCFGTRLRSLRKSHHLTQQDMAVKFGIDRSYISDVERGKKGISLAMLEVVALGFNIKLSELFEDL